MSREGAALSMRSAPRRYRLRTAPRLLTAERQVAYRQAGATTLNTAYAVEQERLFPPLSPHVGGTQSIRVENGYEPPEPSKLGSCAGASSFLVDPARTGQPYPVGHRSGRNLSGNLSFCTEMARGPVLQRSQKTDDSQVARLGSCRSTIELHPLKARDYHPFRAIHSINPSRLGKARWASG